MPVRRRVRWRQNATAAAGVAAGKVAAGGVPVVVAAPECAAGYLCVVAGLMSSVGRGGAPPRPYGTWGRLPARPRKRG